jgi:N-acetylmuramoyl-L-alanine amidase
LETLKQQFQVIVRATEGLEEKDAAKNLLFFVEIGILSDENGKIRELAGKGVAPILISDLIVPTGSDIDENPLIERTLSISTQSAEGFQIVNHILLGPIGSPVSAVETPNSDFVEIIPEIVVIHYSTGSVDATINTLTNPVNGFSTHLVIDREGNITQLLPFDFSAWHAGIGEWHGKSNLNRISLGIMLENYGRLRQNDEGQWYSRNKIFSDDEVIVATHKNMYVETGWHTYTDEQIQTLIDVLNVLFDEYQTLEEVVGNDDISPDRRLDPGPAFPWEWVLRELEIED